MPNSKPADAGILDWFTRTNSLSIPRKEIDEAIENGAELIVVESAFKDPEPYDWSRLFLRQEDAAGDLVEREVGFQKGY